MLNTEEEKTLRSSKLKEIRDELLTNDKAPLYKFRTENHYFPVIGEGNHFADILFVGEAPGQNEAKQGRPFCGASGKFLNVMIESVGLKREDVYIANLIKDRPPENRDPNDEEIAFYSPYLDRQLEIIKPKIIVNLGRLSMKYIMNKFGLNAEYDSISKIHGKVFTAKKSITVDATNEEKEKVEFFPKIVCLYHPAVALYNGSMREVLIKDFKSVVDAIESYNPEKNKTKDLKDDDEQIKLVN